MRPLFSLPETIAFVLAAALGAGASAQSSSTSQDLQPVDPQHGDVNPLRTSTRDMRPDLRVPTGFDRVYRVPGSTRGFGAGGSDTLGAPRFERVSGGLTAVFSRSEYITNKDDKTVPITPPGTVYYIGGVPNTYPAAAPPLRTSPLAVITRVSQFMDTLDDRAAPPGNAAVRADFAFDPDTAMQVTALPTPTPSPTSASPTFIPSNAPRSAPATRIDPPEHFDVARPQGSMLADEAFRRDRIRALLKSAAAAADTGESRPAEPGTSKHR